MDSRASLVLHSSIGEVLGQIQLGWKEVKFMLQKQNIITFLSIIMVVACGLGLSQYHKQSSKMAEFPDTATQEEATDHLQQAAQTMQELTGILLDDKLVLQAELVEGKVYHLQTTREYLESSAQLSTEFTSAQAKKLGFLTGEALEKQWQELKMPTQNLTVAFRTFLPQKDGAKLQLVTIGADLSQTNNTVNICILVHPATS